MAWQMPRWAKLVALALGLVAFVWALAPVSAVVRMVVLGALLAYLLDPLANAVEARGARRGTAAFLVFLGLAVVLGLPLYLLSPALAEQVRSLQEIDLSAASEAIAAVELWLDRRLVSLGVRAPDLNARLAEFASDHVGDVVGIVPGVLGLATQLLVIPFIGFFLLKDGRRFRKGFISLIPNRYFEFTLNVLRKADNQLGGYLRGQLLAATLVGLLATLAMWLLDVQYYFLIGLVAGISNLIPFLGPLIGASLAVVVAAVTTGSFAKTLPIVLAFVTIQLIDNVGSQPLLLSRNVELHPVAILIVLLVAGELFGLLGLLLAVPTAAMIKVFAQEFVTTFRRYHFS